MATSSDYPVYPVRGADALGRALRRRRADLGLTQQEVAGLSMVSRQTIVAIENGRETKALTAIFDTAGALGLELVVRTWVDP